MGSSKRQQSNADTVKPDPAMVAIYYDVFLRFLNTVGAHQHILKLGLNVEEGVFPCQEVAYRYGYRGAALDHEINRRNLECYKSLDNLSDWGRIVNFKPINPDDRTRIIDFCKDRARREYIRRNVKRAMEKGELLSIGDLMFKRVGLEKKRREKATQQAGE